MVRDIETERKLRMLNWLEIQKRIGYKKIKLYMFQVNKTTQNEIIQKGRSLDLDLELVDYRFDVDFLCAYQISLVEEKPVSTIRQQLLSECKAFASVYFDPVIEAVVNSHEIVTTNDCLTNFKYEYEFMSNYDFDEIIFPRVFATNDYQNRSSVATCNDDALKKPLDYNIYKFARRLVDQFGSNVASFHFEHVLFLDNFDESFIDRLVAANGESKKVEYTYYKNQKKVKFTVNNEVDAAKIDFIKKNRELAKCLSEKINKSGKFDPLWNSAYAINFNNRLGKSLFVSNLTELFSQHITELVKPKSKMIRIPIDIGFCSHFRENIGFFFDHREFDLDFIFSSHFQFDIEYLNFLKDLIP